MTVRQLLNNLDSRELSEWMAYYQLEKEDMEKMKQGNKDNNSMPIESKIKMDMTGYRKNMPRKR